MTESITTAAPPRLLRLKEVQERVGMSKTTIYDRIKASTFPAPVHLGTMAAWVESEVDAWIHARICDLDRGRARSASLPLLNATGSRVLSSSTTT